jgi:hypothetical protein
MGSVTLNEVYLSLNIHVSPQSSILSLNIPISSRDFESHRVMDPSTFLLCPCSL